MEKSVPWVPEDIFFLWTLMVRGEAALTRGFIIDKKKNPLEPRVRKVRHVSGIYVKKERESGITWP